MPETNNSAPDELSFLAKCYMAEAIKAAVEKAENYLAGCSRLVKGSTLNAAASKYFDEQCVEAAQAISQLRKRIP